MKGLAQTLVLTGAMRATEMSLALAEYGEGPNSIATSWRRIR